MASRPACDRHPNLQMIRCSASGYECPVPGCDRHCDDNGYFDIEVKSGTKDGTLTRQALVREAIMDAIRDRGPSILPGEQK
jgi:hypothetical protein